MIIDDLKRVNLDFTKIMEQEKEGTDILLIMEGGMGDFIMFLDVFDYIKNKFKHINFKIGSNKEFQYDIISNDVIPLNPKISKDSFINITRHDFHKRPIENKYYYGELKPWRHVIKIKMTPMPRDENDRLLYPKAMGCFKNYLNFDDDIILGKHNKGYIINKKKVKEVNETNRISFHVISNTGRKTRTLKFDNIKDIYNGIKKCGYKPFLIYNDYKWKNPNEPKYDFNWIPEDEKCNINSDVNDIYQYLADSKFFFGIVSGPIFLANKILSGDKRCISINLDLDFNNYLDLSGNKEYDAIVGDFNEDTIIEKIRNMEIKNNIR